MNSGRGGQREGAGRKQAWKHGETQTIRVPKALAAQILEIARRLDEGETIDFVSKSRKKTSPKNEFVTKPIKKRLPTSESVTKSKPSNNVKLETLGVIQPLPGKALARRLGVSDTSLLKLRKGEIQYGIPEWTQARDPDGIAWEYRVETKMFHPLELGFQGKSGLLTALFSKELS